MSLFGVYRKCFGLYSRIAVGVALGILALFASVSLYNALIELPDIAEGLNVPLVGIGLTWGLLSSFALFVFLGFFVCVFVAGLETGLRPIDDGGRKTVEFLIEKKKK